MRSIPEPVVDADNARPTPAVTVVIPTLGGDCLSATIEALNRGSVVPAEILICVPAERAHKVGVSWPNVRVLATECRGQVAQRAVGFRNASHAFVMQLDDDLIVAQDCLKYLLDSLQHYGPRAAVSPSLINAVTGESIYKRPNRSKIVETLYNRVMNGSAGYQQGRIQKSGGAVGVDPQLEKRDSYQVEWLPGGCVLHYKANLVLDDFYPFKGKAYCEDIIHSHYLTSRGVTPIIEPRALCGIEPASDAAYTVGEFLRDVVADYDARLYFMRLTARHSFRLYLFVLARCLSYINGRLMKAMRRPEGLKTR